MYKRPHFLALGVVGLLTITLLCLPQRATDRLKLALSSLYLPLFGATRFAHPLTVKAENAVTSRAELIRQNDLLRRTNEQLQIISMQADFLLRENEQLRQLFGWQRQARWNLKLARVIARDPANWWRILQIDLGSHDGIQPNLPVLTPDGLVGRIATVGFTTSQVVLIGNPDCKISAIVEKTSGVITGSASLFDSSLVNLSFLANDAVIKPGQLVTTSGLGGIFPPGLVIGKIAESPRQLDLGYTEARVKLAASLGTLEEVWVKMP